MKQPKKKVRVSLAANEIEILVMALNIVKIDDEEDPDAASNLRRYLTSVYARESPLEYRRRVNAGLIEPID